MANWLRVSRSSASRARTCRFCGMSGAGAMTFFPREIRRLGDWLLGHECGGICARTSSSQSSDVDGVNRNLRIGEKIGDELDFGGEIGIVEGMIAGIRDRERTGEPHYVLAAGN